MSFDLLQLSLLIRRRLQLLNLAGKDHLPLQVPQVEIEFE